MSTGSTAANEDTQADIDGNNGAGQEGSGTEPTFEHGSDVEEPEEGMEEGEENEEDEEEDGEEGEEEGIIDELDQFNHPASGESNDLENRARIEERGDHNETDIEEENGQLPIERRLHDTTTPLDDDDDGQARLNSNQTESNSIKCGVCLLRTKSAVTFPCRHICMCEICAREKLAEHGVCPILPGSDRVDRQPQSAGRSRQGGSHQVATDVRRVLSKRQVDLVDSLPAPAHVWQLCENIVRTEERLPCL